MDPEPKRPRLPELTSLRFFAAVAVVLYHLRAMRVTGRGGWFQTFSALGYAGVGFFFVLSGFILVYTYAGRQWKAPVFWRARFARIYPAYAFSLAFAAPLFFGALQKVPFFAWAAAHLKLDCLLVATFLQAWVPLAALSWNPVAWSLSVEAFFYLLFPILLLFLVRRSGKQLLFIIFACWIASLSFSSLYVWLRPDGLKWAIDDDNVAFWLSALKFNPLVQLPEFFMGMAAGFLFLRTGQSKDATKLIVLGLAAIVLVTIYQGVIPYPVIHAGLLAPAFAAIIYGFALQPQWDAFLKHPVLVLLGDASYSLYLLHATLIIYFFYAGPRPRSVTPLGLGLYFLMTLVGSVLVYKFLEEPARRWLNPRRSGNRALAGLQDSAPAT